MTDLQTRSVELIEQSQAQSGAYPAALDYPTYRDCWFRDGSYIAHAMDLVGRHDSAASFHGWVAAVIRRRADTVDRAVRRSGDGEPLDTASVLHTRYALDGDEGDTDWPNFQLDGFGTWLWALDRHLTATGATVPPDWEAAAELVAAYLTALWDRPCYDCWEEFPDEVHTHTLAAIRGGLAADQRRSGRDHGRTLSSIDDLVTTDAVALGRFTKYLGTSGVDTSLIGLATPYQMVEVDDPVFDRTLDEIRKILIRNGGGPHRYAADSYYGGGEWVVLAGWLGWHFAVAGRDDEASQLLRWIEDQADGDGNLPEQVPRSLNDPRSYEPWVTRWGQIAQPLLWSHANYLILRHHLR